LLYGTKPAINPERFIKAFFNERLTFDFRSFSAYRNPPAAPLETAGAAMNFDVDFVLATLPAFIAAVGVTLQVGLIAIGTSLCVALINAAIAVFQVPVLRSLVRLYVELARNTPLLIQLFFIYFALPSIGIRISGFASAIIAMTFLGGAYLTEILRAGVEAVPKAQIESGLSIGLSRWQLLRHVILPQAGILSLPALFANFVFLLKETTVVSAVAVPEILYTTKNYIALYYKTYEMLAVMTGLCVLLFVPLSLLLRLVERRLQHGQFGS
jgi:polar amino acid transport system permease protein